MNLFIDTPQRAAERLERERLLAREAEAAIAVPSGGVLAGAGAEKDAAPTQDGRRQAAAEREHSGAPERSHGEPYSIANESYRAERAFDRRRSRRRKLMGALRIVALVVLLPVAIAAVFLLSYGLTCIMRGAALDELLQLYAELFARVEGLVAALAGAV